MSKNKREVPETEGKVSKRKGRARNKRESVQIIMGSARNRRKSVQIIFYIFSKHGSKDNFCGRSIIVPDSIRGGSNIIKADNGNVANATRLK
ncbi:hypothetical protein ACQKCU_09150 [Heyndrickxia sporothermodurans]